MVAPRYKKTTIENFKKRLTAAGVADVPEYVKKGIDYFEIK